MYISSQQASQQNASSIIQMHNYGKSFHPLENFVGPGIDHEFNAACHMQNILFVCSSYQYIESISFLSINHVSR